MRKCQVKENIRSCNVSNDDINQGIHKGPCKLTMLMHQQKLQKVDNDRDKSIVSSCNMLKLWFITNR